MEHKKACFRACKGTGKTRRVMENSEFGMRNSELFLLRIFVTKHLNFRRVGFYIRPLATHKITAIFCRGRVARPESRSDFRCTNTNSQSTYRQTLGYNKFILRQAPLSGVFSPSRGRCRHFADREADRQTSLSAVAFLD